MTSGNLDVRPQGSVLDAFQVELLAALQPYAQEARLAAGERIFARASRVTPSS